MTIRPIWLLCVGLCLVNTGCSMFAAGARNAVTQPAQQANDRVELLRTWAWACAACRELEKSSPGTYSSDYQRGFKRGFTDYVERGGKGEPPVAPSVCYRTVRAENPHGHRAADDWFNGFRDGSMAAMASGKREWVTVPVSTGYETDRYAQARARAKESKEPPVPAEELPPPKVVPEGPEQP